MKRGPTVPVLSVVLLSLVISPSQAKVHTFKIQKEQACNGTIRSDIPPVLTIDSGDTVIFNTVMLLEGKLTADMTIE